MGRADVIRADIDRIRSMSDADFQTEWGTWARSQDRDLNLMRQRWIADLEHMLPFAEREAEAVEELVAAKAAYRKNGSDKNRDRRDAAVKVVQDIRFEERANRAGLRIAGDAYVMTEGRR